MQYLVRPYLPLNLRKVSRILMLELVSLSVCFFCLMLNWMSRYSRLGGEGEWGVFVGFLVPPLLFYKWMSHLIEHLEFANQRFIRLFKSHVLGHCVLIASVFALDAPQLWSLPLTYVLMGLVAGFAVWESFAYRALIKVHFDWYAPNATKFWKRYSLSALFDKSFRRIHQFYLFFVIFFIHVTVFFFWSASHIHLDPDLIKLLPKDFPSTINLKQAEKMLGGFGYVIVMLQSDEAEQEMLSFQDTHQIQLLKEYHYDQGKIKTHKVMNSFGQLTPETQPLIRSIYYEENNARQIWHAELTQTKRLIDRLVERLGQLPDVLYCDYRYPVEFIRNNALLFKDVQDLALLYARVKKTQRTLAFGQIGLDLGLRDDDSGVSGDVDSYFSFLTDDSSVRKDGYYVSADNQTLAFFIKPREGSLNIELNHLMLKNIQQLVRQELVSFQKQNPNFPNIKIGYLGHHQHKVELRSILTQDLWVISFIGALCIISMVVLYFHKYYTLFLIIVPIAMSLIWTFGITYWIVGYLNILTEFLSIILLGLGIDFAIYLLARYYEERARGESHSSALYIMLRFTLKATVTALSTTLAAFFILSLSGFKGFQEFGLLGMCGLLMAYVSMLYVLPITLIMLEQVSRHLKKYMPLLSSIWTRKLSLWLLITLCSVNIALLLKDLQLNNWALFAMPWYYFLVPYLCGLKFLLFLQKKYIQRIKQEHFVQKLLQKPRRIIAFFVVLCLLSAFLIHKVEFDYDFSKVAGQTNSILLREILIDHFSEFSVPSLAIAQNTDEEHEIYSLYKRNKAFRGAESTLYHVNALNYYTPLYQEEKLELIKELQSILTDFEQKTKNTSLSEHHALLYQKLKDFNEQYLQHLDFIYPELVPEEIQRTYRNIHDPKDPRRLVHIHPYFKGMNNGLEIKAFAKEVRGLTLPDKWVSLSEYQARTGMTEEEIFGKIAAEELISKKENDHRLILLQNRSIPVAGEDLIAADILFLVEEDLLFIIIGTCVLCTIILWIDFRDFKVLGVIIISLVAAVLCFLGLMHVAQVKFNILNVVMLPLIFGIIIDGTVHFYHRYLVEGKGSSVYVLQRTGVSILVAYLTSIIGFASLLLAHHFVIKSLGFIGVLGISAGLIVSCVLLPALILLKESQE